MKQYQYLLCSASMIHSLRVVLLFLLTIDAGSTRKKVTKKNTATTLKALMAKYPELKSLSSEQRALQYKAYVLHMNGATSEELDQYKPVSFGWFSCCKDGDHSTGCQWNMGDDLFKPGCYPAPNTQNSCEIDGDGWNAACCRSSPDSRVGSKDWFWNKCT